MGVDRWPWVPAVLLAGLLASPAAADPDPLRTAAALRDALVQVRDGGEIENELLDAAAWFDDVLGQGSDPGEAAMNARIMLPRITEAITALSVRAAEYDTGAEAVPPLYTLTKDTVRRGLQEQPLYFTRLAEMLETHVEFANDPEMLWGSRMAWVSAIKHRQADWRLLSRVERDALPADHPEHLIQVHAVELYAFNAVLTRAWEAPPDTGDQLPEVQAALVRYRQRAGPALDAALASLPAYEAALGDMLTTHLGDEAQPRAAAAAQAYTRLIGALRETGEIIQANVPLLTRWVLDPADPMLGHEWDALNDRWVANNRAVMTHWIAVYDAILTSTEEPRP